MKAKSVKVLFKQIILNDLSKNETKSWLSRLNFMSKIKLYILLRMIIPYLSFFIALYSLPLFSCAFLIRIAWSTTEIRLRSQASWDLDEEGLGNMGNLILFQRPFCILSVSRFWHFVARAYCIELYFRDSVGIRNPVNFFAGSASVSKDPLGMGTSSVFGPFASFPPRLPRLWEIRRKCQEIR